MANWYQLSKKSGVKSDKVVVVVDSWMGRDPRESVGLIDGCGGRVQKMVKIQQSGVDIFEVSPPELRFSADGECHEISVRTNARILDMTIVAESGAVKGRIDSMVVNGVNVDNLNRSIYKYYPVGDPGKEGVYDSTIRICMPRHEGDSEKRETLIINGHNIPLIQGFIFVGRMDVECPDGELSSDKGSVNVQVNSNHTDYEILIDNCDDDFRYHFQDIDTGNIISKVVLESSGLAKSVRLVASDHIEWEGVEN